MPKQPTKAERDHMNRVAELGCLVCKRPAEIHHVRAGMGMGQRASNFKVIPLCEVCHRSGGYGVAFHAGSKTWQARHGTEYDLMEVVALMLDGGDISP